MSALSLALSRSRGSETPSSPPSTELSKEPVKEAPSERVDVALAAPQALTPPQSVKNGPHPALISDMNVPGYGNGAANDAANANGFEANGPSGHGDDGLTATANANGHGVQANPDSADSADGDYVMNDEPQDRTEIVKIAAKEVTNVKSEVKDEATDVKPEPIGLTSGTSGASGPGLEAPRPRSSSRSHRRLSSGSFTSTPNGSFVSKSGGGAATTPSNAGPLNTNSPVALAAAAQVTPERLGRLLLTQGPLAIRHITSHLAITIQGFADLSLSKQRRLIIAVLEGEADPSGSLTFEKVGWGRWAARRLGAASPSLGPTTAPSNGSHGHHAASGAGSMPSSFDRHGRSSFSGRNRRESITAGLAQIRPPGSPLLHAADAGIHATRHSHGGAWAADDSDDIDLADDDMMFHNNPRSHSRSKLRSPAGRRGDGSANGGGGGAHGGSKGPTYVSVFDDDDDDVFDDDLDLDDESEEEDRPMGNSSRMQSLDGLLHASSAQSLGSSPSGSSKGIRKGSSHHLRRLSLTAAAAKNSHSQSRRNSSNHIRKRRDSTSTSKQARHSETDEEDWKTMGAEVLRKEFSTSPYFDSPLSSQPGSFGFSTSFLRQDNAINATTPVTTEREQDAVAALVQLKSV